MEITSDNGFSFTLKTRQHNEYIYSKGSLLNSEVFIEGENSTLSVSLNTPHINRGNLWVRDAIFFSRQCTTFIRQLKTNAPIVLSNLPLDLSISFALSAWALGRAVAFIDPDITGIQQKTIMNKLNPACWISTEPSKSTFPNDVLYLNLADDEDSAVLEDIISENSHSSVDQSAYQWNPTEGAVILFTSGSTGTPKGVCHSLQNLLFSALLFQEQFQIADDDKILNIAPLHTMSGLRCSVFLPLICQCDTNINPISGDLKSVVAQLTDQAYTVFISGPKLIETIGAIAKRIDGLKSLRMILTAGAPLATEIKISLWQQINIPVYNYYGLTETCGLVIAERPDSYDPLNDSLGFPCKDITAAVVDSRDHELVCGEGMLRIYSPGIFLGYWGETLTVRPFFDTGDLVRIAADRQIYFLGRSDQSFKSSSTMWLHPHAIEQWLSNASDVEDFALKTKNLQIVCFVVIKDHSLTSISTRLLEDLGNVYKEIDWKVVNEIERTSLSKVNWNLLENK